MKNKIIALILFFIFILPQSSFADSINLRISYNLNSIEKGDINNWIDSYNTLWKDWTALRGGQATGEFLPIKYGPSYEVEVRIPIYKGFALNLSGTWIKAGEEGRVDFVNNATSQNESHFIRNKVTALPIKIGFSMAIPIPVFPRLTFYAGVGRHIVFIKYKLTETYQADFIFNSQPFNYWHEINNDFKSEALGFYASAGAEFEVFKHVVIIFEAENVWSKSSGFKGAYSYKDYLDTEENGKASLYFYESDQFGLNKHYLMLSGHMDRPEESTVKNVRQGELNLSGLSLKFGIKFKF
ncbi:hypothetical protein ACFLT9_14135 [Acidobacteriota bacterium]